jgi:hypothetical protein
VHLVAPEQRVDANAAQVGDADVALECGDKRRQEADHHTNRVRARGDRSDAVRRQ